MTETVTPDVEEVEVESPITPGVKSSEFKGKTIVQLLLLVNTLFDLGIEISDEMSLGLIAGLESFYGLYRAIVKKGA